MGGHGGLNILPQKSWNVYGQRNRQKVAEDEETHREKEEADQKQRSKGDREMRLQVMRRQAGVQKDSRADCEESQDEAQDGPVFEDGATEAAPKRHINFWSSFEKTSRNPEREVENKQVARSRGDPKTRTSDARFDEQFAVMHGLTGQAPWYARPQQSLYATHAVQSAESQQLPSIQRRNEGSQSLPPRSQPEARRDHQGARIQGSKREHKRVKEPDQRAPFSMASARSDLAAMVGQDIASHDAHAAHTSSDKGKGKHHHEHKRKNKYGGDSEGKARGHGKRGREERRRSRSPTASRMHSQSRRDSSGSSDNDRRGSGSRAARQKSSPVVRPQSGGAKDKFEHLRRERLERERAEAQRTRALLQQHFSRKEEEQVGCCTVRMHTSTSMQL